MTTTRRKLGSSLGDALSLARSANQRTRRRVIAQTTQRIGLPVTGLFDAVCEYPGGGQNVVGWAGRGVAPDVAAYYAAWVAMQQNSPAVMIFTEGAGPDTLAIFEVGALDPDTLARVLDLAATPGRWVLPTPTGLRAMVLIAGGEGAGAVEWLGSIASAPPVFLRGTATILGGSDNAAGRAAYRDIIARAEGTAGDRPTDGAGPVNAPAGGATYRGIFYPGGQVIPTEGA